MTFSWSSIVDKTHSLDATISTYYHEGGAYLCQSSLATIQSNNKFYNLILIAAWTLRP